MITQTAPLGDQLFNLAGEADRVSNRIVVRIVRVFRYRRGLLAATLAAEVTKVALVPPLTPHRLHRRKFIVGLEEVDTAGSLVLHARLDGFEELVSTNVGERPSILS